MSEPESEHRDATPTPEAPAMVEVDDPSPILALVGAVAVLIATVAIFNAMGRTMGLVLAGLAVAVAGVAVFGVIAAVRRGGRVRWGAAALATLAIGLSVARFSGQSVLGESLPAEDPRSMATMPS